ncbi:MAG: hypothetical protein MUF81_04570 [Verrucomicrobia bacterium]|jgi:archaellum component FlaC|nr:hypothetical protein [Verrucomicrobiota bacterium]
MTDKENIKRLEREVSDIKAELERVTLDLRKLAQSTARTRQSTQSAVDGIVHDLKLLYSHAEVPGVTYNPANRIIID